MTLLSLPLSSHLLAFSAELRHQPQRSTTLSAPPRWNLGLIKQTTNDNTGVRFLCSPTVVPVSLGQRVSKFVVPRGLPVEDLLYNGGATVAVLSGAYALVSAFDELTRRNILHQVEAQSSQPHCLHVYYAFGVHDLNDEEEVNGSIDWLCVYV